MDKEFSQRGVIGDTFWRELQVISEILIQFSIFFFLAKWLEAKEFGLYSLITAIVAFFRIFSDFGLSSVILSHMQLVPRHQENKK